MGLTKWKICQKRKLWQQKAPATTPLWGVCEKGQEPTSPQEIGSAGWEGVWLAMYWFSISTQQLARCLRSPGCTLMLLFPMRLLREDGISGITCPPSWEILPQDGIGKWSLSACTRFNESGPVCVINNTSYSSWTHVDVAEVRVKVFYYSATSGNIVHA